MSGRATWAVLGALALIPPAIAIAMVSRLEPGRTGARVVTWYGASGEAIPRESPGVLYPFDGCTGDIGVTGLVHGGALWTTCGPDDRAGLTALARIDPSSGEGRMRWAFPPELALSHTVAIVPRADGALGIVYRHSVVNGLLALAVAGPDGWERAPIAIDDAPAARELPDSVLGAAWVDGVLELVVLRWNDESAPERRSVMVTTLAAEPRVAPFLAEGPLCPPTSVCTTSMALRRDGRWWLVLETERGLVELARDGTRQPSAWRVANAAMMSEQVDNAMTGILHDPSLGSSVLGSDGSLGEPGQGSPGGLEITSAWRYFDSDSGHLSRRRLGASLGPTFMTTQWLGARAIALTASESDDDLRVIDVTDVEHPREHVVAKTTVFSCGELQTGTFLPRDGGGHWLVSSSGCYVALADDLSRADPIGLLDHLRRRGSIGIDWHEHSHELMLGWIVFGMPLTVLAVGAQSALRSRKRKSPPSALSPVLAWALGAYLVSAGWMLLQIAPLFA